MENSIKSLLLNVLQNMTDFLFTIYKFCKGKCVPAYHPYETEMYVIPPTIHTYIKKCETAIFKDPNNNVTDLIIIAFCLIVSRSFSSNSDGALPYCRILTFCRTSTLLVYSFTVRANYISKRTYWHSEVVFQTPFIRGRPFDSEGGGGGTFWK